MTTVGILGAGKLGRVLVNLQGAAGYRTLVAGPGDPLLSALVMPVIAPDAEARWAADVAREGDPSRRAIAVPGDDLRATPETASFLDRLGFDPVGASVAAADLRPRPVLERASSSRG